MTLKYWIAGIGVGTALLGPLLCFLAWIAGRDGQTSLGFAALFLGLGFLILWGVSQLIDDADETEENPIAQTTGENDG